MGMKKLLLFHYVFAALSITVVLLSTPAEQSTVERPDNAIISRGKIDDFKDSIRNVWLKFRPAIRTAVDWTRNKTSNAVRLIKKSFNVKITNYDDKVSVFCGFK